VTLYTFSELHSGQGFMGSPSSVKRLPPGPSMGEVQLKVPGRPRQHAVCY